jgi:hypothetical protein
MRLILVFILFPIISFSQREVKFRFHFKGEELQKNTWYVTNNGDSVQFNTFQFFVSVPVEVGSKINPSHVHLVDWSNPETYNWKYPATKSKNLQFILGLDSIYHVSSVMEGDLNPSLGMYWAWQSGYIQMKVEGKSPSSNERKNKFQYHLGGYLQPFSVATPLDLGEIKGEEIRVDIHLDRFFESIEISNTPNVMIPGPEAMKLMASAKKLFILE